MRSSPALQRSSPDTDSLRSWLSAMLVAGIWFEVLWRAAERAPVGAIAPPLAAVVGLATQLTFTAIETSLAVAAWALLGRRVRWRGLAPALLTASVTEAAAVWVASGASGFPESVRVLLAGTRGGALEQGSGSALARAFASLGLLTLVRLLLATCAHAHELRASPRPGISARRRWQDAALMVLAFYGASRLALWWGLDLLQGRSFEP